MDTRSLLILIPILVIPWLILFLYLVSSNKRVINNYKKLSEKYGLVCDFSKKAGMKNHPSAAGIYRNRNVKIESVMMNSRVNGKNVLHTLLSVECGNSDDFTFTAVKRTKQVSSADRSALALTDDKEFDGKFIIQTNDPVRVKRIFDFNTRFKLDQVHALGFNGTISLNGNLLQYAEKEQLSGSDPLMRFELVMHELCDIADVLKYN